MSEGFLLAAKISKEFFYAQIKRLSSVFGDRAFPPERLEMLYKQLGSMPEYWWVRAIDNFIATRATAPLPKDFIELADLFEREKAREENDRRRSEMSRLNEAEVMAGIPKPNSEFSKECVRILNAYRRKELTQKQFEEACNLLDAAAEKSVLARCGTPKCKKCLGDGYVMKDGLYRCNCEAGRRRPETAQGPKRMDGSFYEVLIPIIGEGK